MTQIGSMIKPNPFMPQIPRWNAMPVYERPVGNGGYGAILGYYVLDADTGRRSPTFTKAEAEKIARKRNLRGW